MQHNIFSSIETISPEMAKIILDTSNVKNRKVSKSNIDALAQEMSSGRWTLNGQSIAFDTNNILSDGQHRLYACIKADKPFATLVVRGVSENAFMHTDVVCRPRGVSDILGIKGLKDSNYVASIAKIILSWESLDDESKHKVLTKNNLTRSDITEFAFARNDFHDSAIYSKKARHLAPPRIIGACHYICCKSNKEKATTFFDSLSNVSLASKFQQSMFLRDRLLLMNSGRRDQNFKEIEIMAFIFKGWNSFMLNKELKLLRWKDKSLTNEKFPIPV